MIACAPGSMLHSNDRRRLQIARSILKHIDRLAHTWAGQLMMVGCGHRTGAGRVHPPQDSASNLSDENLSFGVQTEDNLPSGAGTGRGAETHHL